LHSSIASFKRYYNLPHVFSRPKIDYCVENNLTLDHIFDFDDNIGYSNSKQKDKLSEEDWNLLKNLKFERLYDYNRKCIDNYNKVLLPYKNKAVHVILPINIGIEGEGETVKNRDGRGREIDVVGVFKGAGAVGVDLSCYQSESGVGV